jgi:hypothetical protein
MVTSSFPGRASKQLLAVAALSSCDISALPNLISPPLDVVLMIPSHEEASAFFTLTLTPAPPMPAQRQ